MPALRSRKSFSNSALALSGLGIIILACGSQNGALPAPGDGGAPEQGGRSQETPPIDGGTGGSMESAGAQNGGEGGGGAPEFSGGAPSGGDGPVLQSAGGASAGTSATEGGSEEPGAGAGGTRPTSMGGTGNTPVHCTYHTDGTEAPEDAELPAAGGEGGGGPVPTITVLKNPFVGTYLADSNGKALYVYGRDFAGDCDYPPITNCFDDCVTSWPLFDAVPRLVAPELDDNLFGAIDRMDKQLDGTFKLNHQTTYRGWPLYYYKSDVISGDVKGHGKGTIWHLAEVVLPNLVIIRSGTGDTDKKTLADEYGHTLYTFTEDTAGTETSPPVSACTDTCLDEFPPFMLRYVSAVSYIEPSFVSVFVRQDGSAQLTYKGAPLYYSQKDLRSGDMNGLETPGFTWAAP